MVEEIDEIKVESEAKEGVVISQNPHIELRRTSKGIYSWEIKQLSLNIDELIKVDEELRNKLKEKNLKFEL